MTAMDHMHVDSIEYFHTAAKQNIESAHAHAWSAVIYLLYFRVVFQKIFADLSLFLDCNLVGEDCSLPVKTCMTTVESDIGFVHIYSTTTVSVES